mgnify:CR=1 FL=1
MEGAVFEPSSEILENQGWKFDPVEEIEPRKPASKAVKSAPHDRAIKSPKKTR